VDGYTVIIKKHPIFKRVEDNLWIKLKVPLFLMLTGCENFPVPTISSSPMFIRWSRILHPLETIKIANRGMPIEKSALFGDLYIVIVPEFPEYIDEMTIRKIRKIFVRDKHLIYLKKSSVDVIDI
jgi:DnaJ-class molecular chaperone